MLESFTEKDAVNFYRENIHENVKEGLSKLKEQAVISKGLFKFLVCDNFLSPLTSYPGKGTLQLLFSQPFQRIYDEAYLMNTEELRKLPNVPQQYTAISLIFFLN